MINTETEIKENKIKHIRTYKDGDLLSFINEIRGKENRILLNNFLDLFVPDGSKNIKSNVEKYGLKTKQHFLTKFKNDSLATSKIQKNIDNKLQETATKVYVNIYLLWLKNQSNISKYIENFDNIDLGSNEFIDKVIEGCKQEKYPKEIVEKFYQYSPFIEIDETIERKISRLKYQYTDFIDELKKDRQFNYASKEKIEELENANIELTKEIKNLKNNNTKLINDINKLTKENQEIKEQKDKLAVESDSVAEDFKVISKENLSLKNENSQLRKEISMIDNISNPLKMKESLQNKINELNKIIINKNKEIEDLKYDSQNTDFNNNKISVEYLSLKQQYDKLANIRMQEFDKKIQEDKKLQQIILKLILNNSTATKLVIEHLNLKEEVIAEGYDFYDNEMLEKRNELKELQKQAKTLENYINQLKNEKKNLIETPNVTNSNEVSSVQYKTKKFNHFIYNPTNQNDYLKIFQNCQDGFIEKFNSSNFIIMHEDEFKNSIDLSKANIPICRVIVEHAWHSYKDWFGEYSDGLFCPSKTMVSDYYKFVKNTSELPFGIIIFEKFNKILPEIYIQPFIEALEQNGFLNLIHPSKVKDDGEFTTIEKLSKLKYIMLESTEDNYFKIPTMLEEYRI